MALLRVMTRGQVTLPREIRRAAGIRPGDVVSFRVAGPGRVELTVLPRLTLAEAPERYRVTRPVADGGDGTGWQERAVRDVLENGD